MIERYTRDDLKAIWSDQNRFDSYLKVEIAVLKALASEGIVPKEDVEKIEKNASFDLERIRAIEKETKHDVIAFTRAISESLGEERKWVHYGLTSTYVVDTAYALMYKKANDIIYEDLLRLQKVLKDNALLYKDTPCIGRTHGIHAEITSFGLKWALYYDELSRDIERFSHARKMIETGKISGAVGTFANVEPSIQDKTCASLGLNSAKISTQVLQRDRHIEYFSTIALIGTTLEKIALEIRHLQRTEVSEVNEYFDKNQKGSSAMPHKKNPIGSENICGLSRVLRGYAMSAFEDNALWHERDISHSSVERIIAPDATTLLDYMLNRLSLIAKNLIVHKERMIENIYATYGVIFSGRFVNKLVEKGLSREEAYDLIQPLALKSYNERIMFKELLLKDQKLMSIMNADEIEDCFDLAYHLRHVDDILKRVGIM